MDMPVYRMIDLARLLFFRALLLEAERRRDVSPSTSAHDTLQTARTHRRRAARRGRGVRPTGTPLSARGVDSRQRAVDLRPMPDLCGQRARRGRLFAFDANGELIEAPTPAGDAPSARRTARPSRGAVPFAERPVPSAAGDVSSAAWDVHAAVRDVLAPAEDVPSLERAARSSRRPILSSAGDVHAAVRDRGDSSEARYAALAKRSAQTADRLLRRVSRHRAKGR